MKKNNLFIILAVIVFLAFFGYIVSRNMSFKKTGTGSQNGGGNGSGTQNMENLLKGEGSLKDLLGLGKNVKCTVTVKGETEYKQTMYIAGTQMRTDMKMNVPDIEGGIDSHMILDGNTMYAWNSQSATGTKMDVTEFKDEQADIDEADREEANKYLESLDQKVEYDCDAWMVDKSRFTLPAGIEFVDMTEMLKNVQNTITEQSGDTQDDGTDSLCKMCDTMSGDAKANCIKAVCN